MKILHSVRPLLKWKYIPSTVWSRVGQGEIIHGQFQGDCRNLSIYGKVEVKSISKPNHRLSMVAYTQGPWFERSFHNQHGGAVTGPDRVDTSASDNAAMMERIESRINQISESVLMEMEENEKVGDDVRTIVVECVGHLYSLRLSAVQIQHFMIEHQDMYIHKAFIPITQFLYKNGLNGRRTCKLVSKYPEVLDLPKDVIREKIEHLRDLGFISADILLILEGLPEVLQMPPKTISRRITDLEILFKSKDVLDLISKSPALLIEDLSLIRAKFSYVFHAMGITQRQIMYSSLFKHSLDHIRQRHVFLVRAGFYKKRVKKGQINPNPILEDIIDISTRVFLKKYGNMTMSDYVAFCELFERETRDLEDEVETGENSDVEETHEWKR